MHDDKIFGPEKSIKPALKAAPFAIFAGLAFVIPYTFLAFAFGVEFPSLVGSLIGLVLVVFAATKGFLMPKDTWDFGASDTWEPDWRSVTIIEESSAEESSIGSVRAWIPYVIIAVILVISRLFSAGFHFLHEDNNFQRQEYFRHGS